LEVNVEVELELRVWEYRRGGNKAPLLGVEGIQEEGVEVE